MSDNSTSSTVQIGPGLIGLCTLATIALVILKVTEVLSISWFIVFLPLIIGFAVNIVILVLAFIILIIVAALGSGK